MGHRGGQGGGFCFREEEVSQVRSGQRPGRDGEPWRRGAARGGVCHAGLRCVGPAVQAETYVLPRHGGTRSGPPHTLFPLRGLGHRAALSGDRVCSHCQASHSPRFTPLPSAPVRGPEVSSSPGSESP